MCGGDLQCLENVPDLHDRCRDWAREEDQYLRGVVDFYACVSWQGEGVKGVYLDAFAGECETCHSSILCATMIRDKALRVLA